MYDNKLTPLHKRVDQAAAWGLDSNPYEVNLF